MNFAYIITGIYVSIFALLFYFTIGRKSVAEKSELQIINMKNA